MAIITAIKPQKKEGRFNIFLAGQFAFSLPAEALAKAGLHEDQELSAEKVAALIKESDFAKAFDRVLKFLSYRPRSEREIKNYLTRKKIGQQTQELVLAKLKKLDFINDEAFAQWWIAQRRTFRLKGRRLIRQELLNKGVAKELADQLLTASEEEANEGDLAEKIALKKLAKLKDLPEPEVKKKLFVALAGRGFSFEIIRETVAKILQKE